MIVSAEQHVCYVGRRLAQGERCTDTLKPQEKMTIMKLEIEGRKVRLTLAAKKNSKSSFLNVLSSMAVLIASSNNASFRNKYSVTPNQMRKSYSCQSVVRALALALLTGVEQIMWS
jgi:hypothetical protein